MGRHIGFKHSEETKQKISKANKGRKLPPFSKEHRAKIGEAHKGQIPANTGTYMVNELTLKKQKNENKRFERLLLFT